MVSSHGLFQHVKRHLPMVVLNRLSAYPIQCRHNSLSMASVVKIPSSLFQVAFTIRQNIVQMVLG
jgi:hypothetical protein